MFQNYLPYLPVLAAALVFLAIGALCFAFSQRALETSRKKLSWVRRHGKKGYPFAANRFPNKPADWLGVFATAVFALVVAMMATALRAVAGGANWLSGVFSLSALTKIVIDVCGAIALYLLLQRMFGSTAVSASVSLLFAASFVGSPTAASMLSVALLLLVLWMTARQETLFPDELLYYAACFALCLAISIRPALLPFVLLFIGLHLFKLISYLRTGKLRPGTMALALFLALLAWALGTGLYLLGRIFFAAGLNAALWGRILEDTARVERQLLVPLHNLTAPLTRSRVLLPAMEAPLLGIGGFGLISALLLLIRRKDPRALLALLVGGVALLVWILSDTSVLSLGFALPAALLYSNFERGEKKLPIILTAVLGVIYYLALYFLACYLPMTQAILDRLG